MDEVDVNMTMFVANFQWKQDKFPNLRILKSPPFIGDCKDFAITVAWICAGQSVLRMIWNLLTWQTVIWVTLSSRNGVLHAITWHHGRGWIDNVFPTWGSTPRHTLILPYNIAPLVTLAALFWGV